ncbi:unnamed protein product [Calypogeia fissa]
MVLSNRSMAKGMDKCLLTNFCRDPSNDMMTGANITWGLRTVVGSLVFGVLPVFYSALHGHRAFVEALRFYY